MRKLFAFLLALAMVPIAVFSAPTLAGAAPGRWVYCNVTHPAGVVTFYDNQGYCGTAYSVVATPGTCQQLPAHRANWAGSVANMTNRGVIMSDSGLCAGAPSAGLGAFNTHPNLYSIHGTQLGNKVSSFQAYPV